MFALERQKKIMEILSVEGAVSVSRLSSELGVTEETVRRDLEKLERQNSLKRTHGGAVPIDETPMKHLWKKESQPTLKPSRKWQNLRQSR